MRRTPILISLFTLALLGAATTIALTWGLALRRIAFPFFEREYEVVAVPVEIDGQPHAIVLWPAEKCFGLTTIDKAVWPAVARDDHRITVHHVSGFTNHSEYRIVAPSLASKRLPSAPGTNASEEFWFGWPCRCMWAARDSTSPGGPSTWVRTLHLRYGHPLEHPFVDEGQSPFVRPLALPIGFLPRGVALNTGFYAAAWWTIFFGLARARAWNRRRRGLCPYCSYSLTGLEPAAPCPECGATQTRIASAHA